MSEADAKKDFTDLPTASIKGLEIFSSGKWNGDEYSDADLDTMVAAFGKVGFEPTIKAGHADGQESEKRAREVFGAPALGYAERIYRSGNKLLADFKDIPRKFADLIKAGAYKRVSSEVYWNYKRGDEVFPRVLKAVAFLGADIPAITNLKAVESLYKQSDTGSLFAYDAQDNEFHVYERDYCGDTVMPMARKLEKSAVNYSEDGGSDSESCGDCRYFMGNNCSVVEGYADYSGTCDLQKPRPQMKPKEMSKVEDAGDNVPLGGSSKIVADENLKKKLSQRQLGGIDMTEEEVNALLKKREDELKTSMFKEFEDRIHKAREEGKEEANREAELLREDIRKLQLEKRSERIEHWIKTMKDSGKLLPSEESKVRSLRQWMPDEGPELKYFAVKDGKTSEYSVSPAELLEDLIAKRQSVFATYSRPDQIDDDDGPEMEDPGAEVDRRAKSYMDKQSKDGKAVSYGDALKFVLRTNAGLAKRYQEKARPN